MKCDQWSISTRCTIEALIVVVGAVLLVQQLFAPALDDLSHQVIRGPKNQQTDTNLILWILSWDYHALTTEPRTLFHANILHPAPSSLATTEHMLGYLPLYAPPYGTTGNPLLALQITVLLSFALSGAAMYALLRHWGCLPWAAAFGGFVLLATPGKFQTAYLVQLTGWFYLPLAIVFLDRAVERGRGTDAAVFGGLLALQMLCSFYVAFISLVIVSAYAIASIPWRERSVGGSPRGRVWLRTIVIGFGVAALLVVPFAFPYAQQIKLGEIDDHTGSFMVVLTSFRSWRDYLLSPGLHSLWRAGPGRAASYLGILPVCFAIAALVLRTASETAVARRRVWGIVLGVLVCWVLAMGPSPRFEGIPFPPLYDLLDCVPGFSSMRAPSRFSLGVVFGISALSGIGLSALLQRLQLRGWIVAAILAGSILWTWFDFGHPYFQHQVMRQAVGESVPEVYRELAAIADGPVLEVPAGWQRGFKQIVRESEYTYFSIFHWKPLLNGYTGYLPRSTKDVMVLAQALPDRHASFLLSRMTGLRYVVVHLSDLGKGGEELWTRHPGLRLLRRYGDDLLFEVSDRPAADLRDALLARVPTDRTLMDHPIRALGLEETNATLRFVGSSPINAVASFPRNIQVWVRNDSQSIWAALAPGSEGTLSWAVGWKNLETGATDEDLSIAPLPYDLLPGESLRTTISPKAPRLPGNYQLSIGLAQGERWVGEPLTVPTVKVGTMAGIQRLMRPRR